MVFISPIWHCCFGDRLRMHWDVCDTPQIFFRETHSSALPCRKAQNVSVFGVPWSLFAQIAFAAKVHDRITKTLTSLCWKRPTNGPRPSQSSFDPEWKRIPLCFSVVSSFCFLGLCYFRVPDYELGSEPIMSTPHGKRGRLRYINKTKMASVFWPYVSYFFIAGWGPLAQKPSGTKLRFFRLGHL